MQNKQPHFLITAKIALLLLLCSGLVTGCMPSSPGGKQRPERKKMFTLDGTDGSWEGYSLSASRGQTGAGNPGAANVPLLPFSVGDTVMGAGLRPYMLVRLPSADYDFLLPGAKNYEALFPGWLKNLPQTGRDGLVIDLASGKASNQSVFQLGAPGLSNAVPLILLWDTDGEKRVGFYTQLLQSFTTIRCENIQSGKSH